MRVVIQRVVLGLSLAGLSACAHGRAVELAPRPGVQSMQAVPAVSPLAERPEAAVFAAAIGARVADLKARGGECEEYGSLLESALASGHITLRPFMWRVDGNLASAEGESSGEIRIARDIDSLNVGVRKLEDVLRSAEHEAAHIALRIPSGDAVREARVDASVRSCRSGR